MSFQSTSASATRLRSSLLLFLSWSIVRLLGPDIYSLLSYVGIRRGWIELMLITVNLLNAFVYYTSRGNKAPAEVMPAGGRRKSSGLQFSSPTHRRLQGLAPRQRPKSFGLPSLSSSSAYASTPLSGTSYRVASPLSQSFTNMSMSSTNSSPLARYSSRGRHSIDRAHPLDTSLLDRLLGDRSDDEEE